MVCSIAENMPLRDLKRKLELPFRCHSVRKECVHGFSSPDQNYTLGVPGAAIGYCQALFNRSSSTLQHTRKVQRLLKRIDAPWANSHELFWGYRNVTETAEQYVHDSMTPLIGGGRVPILITALDPARDLIELATIFASEPTVAPDETILIRIVLDSDKSLEAAARLIKKLASKAFATSKMPRWWPLFQGELSLAQWIRLRDSLGELWAFANIAVNPFCKREVFEFVSKQITVAQVVVGLADGISERGVVTLAPGMKISGADECGHYNLPLYMENLSRLEVCPTIIILGPAQPGWGDQVNQERIRKLLPVFREGCEVLWARLDSAQRRFVWQLSA